jgi:ureidoglycolate hydrolase
MDEALLEIRQYTGEGYLPLIDFNTWRVAILRWELALLPENIDMMERHTQTDEVFVLLEGQATLILGGNSDQVDGIHPQALELCKLYNVKQNTWHTILLSRDVSILIIENRNTGEGNSEYYELSPQFKKEIISLSMNGCAAPGFGCV